MDGLKTLALIIAAMFAATYAHGAVVVLEDVYASAAPNGAPTDLGGGTFGYEFTLDPGTEFSAAGHDKLVVSFTFHDGEAYVTAPTVSKVFYNGVELTQAVQAGDNWSLVQVGVYYLDNVVSDGTIRFEMTQSTASGAQLGFSAFALDGLLPGVADTGSAPNNNQAAATVSITTDEGFFVQEAARNNQSLGDAVDDYTTLYNFSSLSYRGLSQYQVTSSPGDYLAPINNTGANAGRFVTAAFEAVPEPASLAMGMFGLTMIAARRRR
jgi:hypothetical protein